MSSFRDWLEGLADAGALLPARVVLDRLPPDGAHHHVEPDTEPAPSTWKERLWTVPAETRLGVGEVCEALGKSASWCYKRTMKTAARPIPHRRMDGALVFVAGELRTWIRSVEGDGVQAPMDTPRRAS